MIKPLPGYVLIEPIEDDEKTAGGLYVPDSAKDKPMKGRVTACGANIKPWGYNIDPVQRINTMECPVSVNQTVIYKKWTNQEVTDDGKEYLLVAFSELLGIIE